MNQLCQLVLEHQATCPRKLSKEDLQFGSATETQTGEIQFQFFGHGYQQCLLSSTQFLTLNLSCGECKYWDYVHVACTNRNDFSAV